MSIVLWYIMGVWDTWALVEGLYTRLLSISVGMGWMTLHTLTPNNEY